VKDHVYDNERCVKDLLYDLNDDDSSKRLDACGLHEPSYDSASDTSFFNFSLSSIDQQINNFRFEKFQIFK